MTKYFHGENIKDSWQKMTIAQQLGNVGSEVSRAKLSQSKDSERFQNAVARALELFDLTLFDPRWKNFRGRLIEIGRMREVFCDAISGGKEYDSTLAGIQKYFDQFALEARK